MTDSKKELTLTREFNAPRELVFKAWTDKNMVQEWWAPNGVTNQVDEWDVTPGGAINLTMIAGKDLGPLAGQHWPMMGEFEEVEEPSKLVFTANAVLNGKEILKHRTTVTFENLPAGRQEHNGKTNMKVHIVVIKTVMPEAEMALKGMEMGWNQQLDKLVKFIEKQ